jgi:endonuclease YncB( thermonuclease family)
MRYVRQSIPPSSFKSLCALALLALIVALASRREEKADGDRRGAAAASRVDMAPTFNARVLAVADGDTLTVSGDGRRTTRIRLHGIDAPELRQPFGRRAREALADLVGNRTARVVGIETDRYERLIADLYVGTNWVNATLVAEGWAWHYRYHSDARVLAAAERRARDRSLGLWRDHDPVPPWNWRQLPENRSSGHRR